MASPGLFFVAAGSCGLAHAPTPRCPLLPPSQVLLTSGGTAKLADVAFSRELIGEVLPDVPLIGTFPW